MRVIARVDKRKSHDTAFSEDRRQLLPYRIMEGLSVIPEFALSDTLKL